MHDPIGPAFSAMLEELASLLAKIDASAVGKLAGAVHSAPNVFTAGAGRSGLLLRCAAMRFMHLGIATHVVGEAVTPALQAGDLLLLLSGSGETGSLLALAGKARTLGARLALVTANTTSTLAGLAELSVIVPAPTPKAAVRDCVASIQPMGSLFEQGAFLLLEAVTLELMRRRGNTSEGMFARHANLE